MRQKHIHFSWNPVHPRRDWIRLLGIFVLLLLVVIGWSTYLFYSSVEKTMPEALGDGAEKKGTSKQLESISSFLDKR